MQNPDLPKPQATLILGFGNPIWSDDGAGIEAVNKLLACNLPPGTRVEAVGLPGYGLAALLDDMPPPEPSRLIIIDAARMGLAPGQWRRFGPEEVRLITGGDRLSLHQGDLSSGLALAQALGILPDEVIFYAVEPESLEDGMELSSSVRAALPEIVENILFELWENRENNEQ